MAQGLLWQVGGGARGSLSLQSPPAILAPSRPRTLVVGLVSAPFWLRGLTAALSVLSLLGSQAPPLGVNR